MDHSRGIQKVKEYGAIVLGGAVFALAFNWFLQPNHISAGGLSGLSLILVEILGFGSVGVFTALLNIPLFVVGWRSLGRTFFVRSLTGMLSSSVFLELFRFLPVPQTDTLLGALAGGILCGIGIGLVFTHGATTGGADMVARLLKEKFPSVPMGRLIFFVDIAVVSLTGLVFRDLNKALYSAVTLYVSSLVVDKIIYGPDVSAVATVISEKYDAIAAAVGEHLHRGVTVLPARGYHTGKERPVLLCAVRKSQVTKLKKLITSVDADAFFILQEAHQVFGMGFRRYSSDDF